jgi:hypothetical protein
MNAPPSSQNRHLLILQTLNQLRLLHDVVQGMVGSGREEGVDHVLLEAQSYLREATSSLSKAEQLTRQK